MTDNQRRAYDELSKYLDSKRKILRMKQQIEIHESKCHSTTRAYDSIMKPSGRKDNHGAMIMVPIAVQTSGGNSSEDLLEILIDQRAHYGALMVEAERVCMAIQVNIAKRCNAKDAELLTDIFINGFNMIKVAYKNGYCYKQTIRLKYRALERYGEKMSHNVPHHQGIIIL